MKQNIKRNKFSANLINPIEGRVNVRVDIVSYIDENICYLTCPALDIIGYGNTESEARRSFETTLLEYVKYTVHKKTLKKDLLSMGWKQKGKNNFIAPSLIEILNEEPELRDLLNTIPFQKTSRSIELPAFA